MSVENNGKHYRVVYKYKGKTCYELYPTRALAMARVDTIKAEKEDGIIVPPHELLDPARAQKEHGHDIAVVDAEYVEALLDCEDIQMRVFLRLSAEVSLRIGEITGLLWDDVIVQPDLTAELVFRHQLQRINVDEIAKPKQYTNYIEVPGGAMTKDTLLPKTKLYLVEMNEMKYLGDAGIAPPPRPVFVGEDLVRDLLELRERQETMKRMLGDAYFDMGFVLAQDNGRPYDGHTIRKRLEQLCFDNGLPVITPHSMRRLVQNDSIRPHRSQ